MIGTKCPGQDMRYWTAEDVYEEKCPQCGSMIEFFKTDIRLRCRDCKTRVANPRFNMGCAQWCAYAEQCLGPGAKGLKSKSLRLVLEDALDRFGKDMPDKVRKVKEVIEKAEEKCQKEQIDMLPVIASVVTVFLKNNDLIAEIDDFLSDLNREQALPQKAVNEIKAITETILGNEDSGEDYGMTKIVVELISEI
ncbi:MAG: hypothetical protein ACQESO_06600 [Bacillota bacterium]